jgi:catalase
VRQRTQHPNDDFVQPGVLFSKVMKDTDRDNLIGNIVDHLQHAKKFIQERQVKVFYKCNPEYGIRVAKGLGLNVNFSAKF